MFKCTEEDINKKRLVTHFTDSLNGQRLSFQVVKNLSCLNGLREWGVCKYGVQESKQHREDLWFVGIRWVGVLFSGPSTGYTLKSTLSHLKFSLHPEMRLTFIPFFRCYIGFHFFLVLIVILVGNWDISLEDNLFWGFFFNSYQFNKARFFI